jgi:hypothetical protein
VVSVLIYGALTAWHARQSNPSIEALGGQLAKDDYGIPKSRRQQLPVRVFSAVEVLLLEAALQ